MPDGIHKRGKPTGHVQHHHRTDDHGQVYQDHLHDAHDTGTFCAAEDHIKDHERHRDRYRGGQPHGREDHSQHRRGRDHLGDHIDEGTHRGQNRDRHTHFRAVLLADDAYQSAASGAAEGFGVDKRQNHAGNTRTQGVPPGRHAELISQLGSADGGRTAHQCAGNHAGNHAHGIAGTLFRPGTGPDGKADNDKKCHGQTNVERVTHG